ncbi:MULTISPECIES: type III secretion system chaperone family protein [Oceanospirillaceae]|jgi:hypothetical protein|uniref:hypothetical protein n=1 Tax=Oceanospirillaceae TaxID=135620 RepID=UPI000C4511FA|nr:MULTISPECIES: hypothetical protein [Thalassolituus]MAY15177.1 hypothetical protein [Oceanospirillaceae bacterium]PIQ41416.1 MAG: hypothetical protein COW58_02125 [Thalassolituus sp. CG17_big_fil_post_rev_8_21_14_2_50_53_8]MCA6059433.1 hypothetical protein [Thalassolituus sp. ST750PaO-4]MCB2385688.1 YbjN domain-containing protein [Thalassolituus alkanivorans]MCB2422786.1 YbjN domain-containing protein [Thalassolituus alkanivorans]
MTSNGSTNPYPNPFTSKIVAYCEEIGWNFEVRSETSVKMLFVEDDGRSQLVFFNRQQAGNGSEVVCISSPVVRLSTIQESDIDQKAFFNELLELNGRSANYRWAFTRISEEDELLIAVVDMLLDTMDLKEMAMAVSAVSTVADRMESRFGVDEF